MAPGAGTGTKHEFAHNSETTPETHEFAHTEPEVPATAVEATPVNPPASPAPVQAPASTPAPAAATNGDDTAAKHQFASSQPAQDPAGTQD